MAVSRPEPLPPGCTPLVESDPARVGGYELRARLGDDGHGTLYAARDTTGALIAVRRATGRDLRTRRGFAASATRPAPPFSCAQVLGHGVDDGHPYLAREYVDGISLATLMAEDGPLDIVTLYGLALGTMAALAGLHDTGQAHGNLKPTNVMVTLGGVRLVDQGLVPTAKASAGRAADLRQWAALVHYARGVDDALPQSIQVVVDAAAAATPRHSQTARDLLLALSAAAPAVRRWAPSQRRRRAGIAAAFGAAAAIVVLSLLSSAQHRSVPHADLILTPIVPNPPAGAPLNAAGRTQPIPAPAASVRARRDPVTARDQAGNPGNQPNQNPLAGINMPGLVPAPPSVFTLSGTASGLGSAIGASTLAGTTSQPAPPTTVAPTTTAPPTTAPPTTAPPTTAPPTTAPPTTAPPTTAPPTTAPSTTAPPTTAPPTTAPPATAPPATAPPTSPAPLATTAPATTAPPSPTAPPTTTAPPATTPPPTTTPPPAAPPPAVVVVVPPVAVSATAPGASTPPSPTG